MSAIKSLSAFDPSTMPGAEIGRDVEITCRIFEAHGPFRIGEGTKMEAERIVLGAGAEIGKDVTVKAIRGVTSLFLIGDHALIDDRCNLLLPYFAMGDYTRIFRDALISGYQPTTLGHNCWVGQGAILNSAETLKIGNNVRMGGCQIWTHVASGELLEGSRFYNEAPVVLEDDVWLMGFGHMISPGVTLARGTVVMAGSTVTKSTVAFRTYSGSPARDITERLPAWTRIDPEEKWRMLLSFVDEFRDTRPEAEGRLSIATPTDGAALRAALTAPGAGLIFTREVGDWAAVEAADHSVFDLATKTYTKRRTPLEIAWMRWSIGHRARFLPRDSRTATAG